MPQAATQPPGIFICYRREDSAGHAGRLYDRLAAHFGDEQIFMDLDQIEPGEDFVQVIESAVGSCEILLAVIGRSWLTSRDETGRRLDNPHDFVGVEIAAAFARDVRVIPVLVQGAQMPRSQDLPEALRPLSRRQAFDLSDQRWRQDVDRLVGTLERILARQREARQRAAEEEAERQRREAEARRQAESEAEAQRQAEESERLKRATAETVRQWREAEEVGRRWQGADERERPALQQAASALTRIKEPTKETRAAHDPPAVGTLPASSSDDVQAAAPGTTPTPAVKGRRMAPILTFTLLVALVLATAIWIFTGWKAEGDQVTAGQNMTSAGTPQAGQKESAPLTPETTAPPSGMVYVPGGKFTMGRDAGDEYERPAHEETVGPFFIDIYEVTREDYKECVDEKQCPQPQGWTDGSYPEGTARRPVTGVDWDAASAYAKWRSKREGMTYYLPTEEEWEFAARGTDGRLYPWGSEWRAGRANASGALRRLANVDSYPKGRSPFGVFNMIGNAWEWTADELKAYGSEQILPLQSPGDWRVIRGGSYQENKNAATTTYRRGYPARGAPDYSKLGFRCVTRGPNSPASP